MNYTPAPTLIFLKVEKRAINQYMALVLPVSPVLVTEELWWSAGYYRELDPQYPHVFSWALGVWGVPSKQDLFWCVRCAPGNLGGHLTGPDGPFWTLASTGPEKRRASWNKHVPCSVKEFLLQSHLVNLLIKCRDQLIEEVEGVSSEKCLILCF